MVFRGHITLRKKIAAKKIRYLLSISGIILLLGRCYCLEHLRVSNLQFLGIYFFEGKEIDLVSNSSRTV